MKVYLARWVFKVKLFAPPQTSFPRTRESIFGLKKASLSVVCLVVPRLNTTKVKMDPRVREDDGVSGRPGMWTACDA
jgi:hypothetical protein